VTRHRKKMSQVKGLFQSSPDSKVGCHPIARHARGRDAVSIFARLEARRHSWSWAVDTRVGFTVDRLVCASGSFNPRPSRKPRGELTDRRDRLLINHLSQPYVAK